MIQRRKMSEPNFQSENFSATTVDNKTGPEWNEGHWAQNKAAGFYPLQLQQHS